MKPYPLILLIPLTAFHCTFAAPEGVHGKIIRYGIYKAPDKYTANKDAQSLSGNRRSYSEMPNFTSSTTNIQARLGVHFGIAFELSNLPSDQGKFEYKIVKKCPGIHRPDG